MRQPPQSPLTDTQWYCEGFVATVAIIDMGVGIDSEGGPYGAQELYIKPYSRSARDSRVYLK